MNSELTNLFDNLPASSRDEHATVLLATAGLRVERIVSTGQASPPGFWFDQEWNEWVVVLKGSARLLFEGETAARNMGVGDFVAIPAHRRHRVESTDPASPTVWLAIHYR